MQKLATKLESQLKERQGSFRAPSLSPKKIESVVTKDSKEDSAEKYMNTVKSIESKESGKSKKTITESRLAKLSAEEKAEMIRIERLKIEE